MNFSRYVKDKINFILAYIIYIIILISYTKAMEIDKNVILVISIIPTIFFIVGFIISYVIKNRYIQNIEKTMEGLQEKYLITEIIKKPRRQENLAYYTILKKLLANLPHRIWESCILHTALFLLLLAVTIPYLPDSVPLQAFLHVVFAFTASLLLGLCLYLVLWRLSSISEAAHKILRPYRISMVAITFISAMLLLIAGIISSALEIFFIITTTILVQRLYVLSSCIFSN